MIAPLIIAAVSAGISGISSWMNREAERKSTEAYATNTNTAIIDNQTALTAQWDNFQKLYAPTITAGNEALKAKEDLMGMNGEEAQKAAVDAIANNPQLQEQMLQGENAMRQNASATGGLRGGNFQGAMAQYRPGMVNAAIDQKYSQLDTLIGAGSNAAGIVGNAGMNYTNAMGNMNMTSAQMDSLLAGNPSGGFNAFASVLDGVGSGLGTYAGMGGDFGLFDKEGNPVDISKLFGGA